MPDDAPVDVAPALEAAPVEAAAPEATPETEVDPFDNAETDKFDRAYVEKIRKEAANYRTKAKEYEIFESYEQEQRDAWKELASTFQQDPRAGAELMKEIYESILAEGGTPAEAEAGVEAVEEGFLTKSDLEKYLQEQQAQQDQAKAVQELETEAQGLGYTPGTPEYRWLMDLAAYDTSGDVTKAHEILAGRKQAAIDEYIASKTKDADGAGAPGNGTQLAGEGRTIKNLKDSKSALLERMSRSDVN
jgi:hypothetical protein